MKRVICASVLILLAAVGLQAQNERAVSRLIASGDKILEKGAVNLALEQYKKAVELDPENLEANYKAGQTSLSSVDKSQARNYFEKVQELDQNFRFDIEYLIGRSYQYSLEFDQAIEHFSFYQEHLEANTNYKGDDRVEMKNVERRIYECEVGKELIQTPLKLEITNLGNIINSEYGDYAPVLSVDEDMLIFTSRRTNGNQNDALDDDDLPYEDIYISRKVGEEWQPAENIGNVVNTRFHDSALGVSLHGESLFIYKDLNNGDIFESDQVTDGVWSKPFPLKEINSRYTEQSISMSPDGEVVFFSSNRPGGMGGFDIYVSRRERGGWSKPVNAGAQINTEYDEDAAYIHYDGKTLYFSSQGGYGMGGYDIFKSVYDSTNNTWGTPQNLGYPVNTPDDDVHFVNTQDGSRAYYASVREDGLGYTDIYMITNLEGDFREEKPKLQSVSLVINVVGEDNAPVDATVSTNDGSIQLAKESLGKFVYSTKAAEGKSFSVEARLSGYTPKSVTVDLPGATAESQEVSRTISLSKIPVVVKKEPVKEPEPVRKTTVARKGGLRNLYFDFDKTEIREEFYSRLEEVKELMSRNPGRSIKVVGHSDNVGTTRYNEELSMNRAKKVVAFLVSQGISSQRFEVEGLGAKFPLASNDDEEEGRELNRRVEFKIVN